MVIWSMWLIKSQHEDDDEMTYLGTRRSVFPFCYPSLILASVSGITGHVRIDDDGDRDADYSILDLDPITGKFEVVAHYLGLQE